MSNWPESTCVECGKRIPAGQMQHCVKGGYCDWHVPAAVRDYIDSLQASHEELVKALEEIQNNGADYCICTMIATEALANAAKLAPTK